MLVYSVGTELAKQQLHQSFMSLLDAAAVHVSESQSSVLNLQTTSYSKLT